MVYRHLLATVTAVLILLFVIQNMATVEVQFLFWSLSLPRSVILLCVFGAGILIGWLWRSYLAYRKERERPTR